MAPQNFIERLSNYIEQFPETSYQIGASLLAILLLWLIRIIAFRIVNRRVDDPKVLYKWRKNLSYLTVFLGLLIVGRIWFEALHSVATFLGLVSAGLAIALRDPLTDIAGWLFIIWRKPLDVGDRIQVGEVKGDVIDIRIFMFTVLEIGNWIDADQSTGRVVHVPNHQIFTESLANYTSDFEFIWNELSILLTFESDWKTAKKILQEIAETHLRDLATDARKQLAHAKKSYLIHYSHLTPIVYTDVRENGIKLTIRHLINPRKRRAISQAIWEDILDRLKEHEDIDLTYPTMRIVNR